MYVGINPNDETELARVLVAEETRHDGLLHLRLHDGLRFLQRAPQTEHLKALMDRIVTRVGCDPPFAICEFGVGTFPL